MQEESLLEFYFHALGVRYTLLLPLAGLVSFVLALTIVIKGKGPTVGPALVLAALSPIMVGLLGYVDGMIASYTVIAMSTTTPSPAEVAQGTSMSLVSLTVGMFLGIPGYLTALIGAAIRAFTAER